ncbi:Hypothetical predicted protein [Mytilus galloprovincialis]|uniref:C2H2-type domain-containing protein n=1 Tax=Mytilus galloprovincialis TaxID=29158 RepID=A0A8B6DRX5_MYTGA|nr:Hypothetical predicted protein [Mytilus galloprovincialis]
MGARKVAVILHPFGNSDSVKVGKVTLKTSPERVDIPDTDSTETEEQDEEDTEAVNSIGFACPEPGCQREFVSANGLERHIFERIPSIC